MDTQLYLTKLPASTFLLFIFPDLDFPVDRDLIWRLFFLIGQKSCFELVSFLAFGQHLL